MFKRDIYFNSVRSSLFGGAMNQGQVEGQETILSIWEWIPSKFPDIELDMRWLAYMLATTYHETAYTIQPITEHGSQSYLQGKSYYPYIGRGYVQLTWDYNYEKATIELNLSGTDDLVKYPDRALDHVIAAKVLFLGMYQGWFTSKKLSQYFNASKNDPKNARQIINGNDDDVEIAGFHDKFLKALNASWDENYVSVPPPDIEDPTKPEHVPKPNPNDKWIEIAIAPVDGITFQITVGNSVIVVPGYPT